MKKISIFIWLSITCSLLSAKDLKGTIIYADGKKVSVTLDVPMDVAQTKVSFYDMHKHINIVNASGKKEKIKPNEVKEVQFDFKDQTYRMVSRFIKPDEKIFILLLIENERLSLYRRFEVYATKYGLNENVYDYYQKGDEALSYFKSLGFKKNISPYFDDCPQLVEKIENGDYKSEDGYDIATYYLENCK